MGPCKSSDFILSEIVSHWRVLSKRMTWSDSSFKRITLAAVLGGDCREQGQKPLGSPTGQGQDKKSAKEWTEK